MVGKVNFKSDPNWTAMMARRQALQSARLKVCELAKAWHIDSINSRALSEAIVELNRLEAEHAAE